MDKPCPKCHSMSLNSNMKHGQSKFLCGSVRHDSGKVDQSMICTRIERLEAKLERYEKALQIAARDYVAVCDYPLASKEAIDDWTNEAALKGEQDG